MEEAAEIERRALEMSQSCFVVQYCGHAVSDRETVLVMELLDDLTKIYTSRNLAMKTRSGWMLHA